MSKESHFRSLSLTLFVLAVAGNLYAQKKPNILVIFGDDIGQSNVSAYSRGLMGFMTPNIDRIGAEGGVFVQYYGQQSCTAGRAAFITGQCPYRTGLTKVGLPGAPEVTRNSLILTGAALRTFCTAVSTCFRPLD